jgi:hypothetical protein
MVLRKNNETGYCGPLRGRAHHLPACVGTNYIRLGVARPFLMLKALFLILPLILPFKH